MQVFWEHQDIKGGRIAKHPSGSKLLISYCEAHRDDAMGSPDTRWQLTAMTDGLVVIHNKTKNEVASWLTNSLYLPIEIAP